MAKKLADQDQAMVRGRAVFEKSGLTLEALGKAMGYEKEMARISAWQFLNKTTDPRLSMLRRFANAMEVPLEELVSEKGEKKKGQPKQAGQ